MTIALSEIRPPAEVKVVTIRLDRLSSLLSRMGIREGSNMELHSIAPLGDPIAVRCGGLTIAIRKSDAAYIDVLPL